MTDQVLKPTPEQIDRERAGLAKLGIGIDANGVLYALDRRPLHLQCGYPIEPVQNGAARRCMVTLAQHEGPEALDHAYVSLMVPCVGCRAAISWSAHLWRDTWGANEVGPCHHHEPDPRYL